jgi:hypothetical protein
MNGQTGFGNVGQVNVFVANNRGFTAEEIAERAIDKIISVGNESASEVREQALAFKSQIHGVLLSYLKEAQQNERLTICNKLSEAGLGDAAEFVKHL